jgi:3-hydroxybutyrate dehydrogenase
VAYHGADMSKPAEIEDMMKYAAASSAGWTSWSTTPASSTWPMSKIFPVERWDAIIAINLSSAFHATRLAAARHEGANWGRIINVASVHGLVARRKNRPTWPPSTASWA